MPRSKSRLGKSFYQKLTTAEKTHFVGWLDGANKVEVNRPMSGEMRKRVNLSILPFGAIVPASPTATDYIRVAATTQAIVIAKIIQATMILFGINDEPPVEHVAQEGFYPALAVASLWDGIEKPKAPSGFTGSPVAQANTRSGSIPFGRLVATPSASDYDTQVKAITSAWGTLTPATGLKKSISFRPEVWDKPPAAIGGNAKDVAGTISFT